MAESQAIIGWGSTITGMQNAEITSISGPTATSDKIDVTHYASPSGYKEFILGLVDPGDFSCTCNYTVGAYNSLKNLQINRTKSSFSLSFPDGGDLNFDGYVMTVGLTAPVAGKVEMNVNIAIAGAIT